MKYGFLIICFCLTITANQAFSQNNCTEALKKAQRAYNEGVIEKVYGLLKPCLDNQMEKELKLQALKLIILSNLYEEKIQDAETNMLKFLELEPEYEINPSSDPEEFANIFNTFQTSPLWSIGAFGGASFPLIRQLEEYGTYNTREKDYDRFESNKFSFHIGGRVNRYVAKNTEVQLELMFEQLNFEYSVNPDFNTIAQQETQSYLNLPISATYDFMPEKKFRPFVRLGFSVNYLLNASADLTRTYEDNSFNADADGSIDLKDFRKPLSFSVMAGTGLKWKVKRAYIVMDLRYRYGLNNLVDEESRREEGTDGENYDRIFRIHKEDDNFAIDNLSINIGYVRNIYKPRKRSNK